MISFKQFLVEYDTVWDQQIINRIQYVENSGILLSLMLTIEKAFPGLTVHTAREPCCAAMLHLNNIGKLQFRTGKPGEVYTAWKKFNVDNFTFEQRQAFNRIVMLGKKYL